LLEAVTKNSELERKEFLSNLANGKNVTNAVWKLARRILAHQRQNYACGVGRRLTSVGIDGGLYACHRFTNDPDWKVGDVDRGLSVNQRFIDRPVGEMPKCKTCWARYLCGGGCRHDNFTSMGDPFTPDPMFCAEMMSYIENAIVLACEVTRMNTQPKDAVVAA
jgi:uncharacterized protein